MPTNTRVVVEWQDELPESLDFISPCPDEQRQRHDRGSDRLPGGQVSPEAAGDSGKLSWRCVEAGGSEKYVLATQEGHREKGWYARLPDERRVSILTVITRDEPAILTVTEPGGWGITRRTTHPSVRAAKAAAKRDVLGVSHG